jgi:integrator complex subunit 11
MEVKCIALGAAQFVGKSCIYLEMGPFRVVMDAGIHVGKQGAETLPDFDALASECAPASVRSALDAILISHVHLDHMGALPTLVRRFYGSTHRAPVFASFATLTLAPLMLRNAAAHVEPAHVFLDASAVSAALDDAVAVSLGATVTLATRGTLCLQAVPHYAGHVLGAVMWEVTVRRTTDPPGTRPLASTLYTGDFNMTPDRHVGGASVPRGLAPDLLISESTYGTKVRSSKKARERQLLARIAATIQRGGKVLIPVFALGRAQELCILLDDAWERLGFTTPVLFSAGLASRVTDAYAMLSSWASARVKRLQTTRNVFEFRHVIPFDERRHSRLLDSPGPLVLFATPGMLHAGTSLAVFKKWAGDPLNTVIIPGFCEAGTVGGKLLAGHRGAIRLEHGAPPVHVACDVQPLSFSAHADCKGIWQLILQCTPAAVLFVHGEKKVMEQLASKVASDFGVPTFTPAVGDVVTVTAAQPSDSSTVAVTSTVRRTLQAKRGATIVAGLTNDGTVISADEYLASRQLKRCRVHLTDGLPPP